jgi:hypothetical protein
VLGFVGDAVGFVKTCAGVDVEFGVGVQAVPYPTHLHAADLGDSGSAAQCGFGAVNKVRVYPDHEADGRWPGHVQVLIRTTQVVFRRGQFTTQRSSG